MAKAMLFNMMLVCCSISAVMVTAYPAATGLPAMCLQNSAAPSVFGTNPFYSVGYATGTTSSANNAAICNAGAPNSQTGGTTGIQTSCQVRMSLLAHDVLPCPVV